MKSKDREKKIVRTSVLNICVNLVIAAIKVAIGLISSSIAIVSEGINNATDALSSTLTIAGTKLSAKHPDKKHPFGYGRIEYLTALIIGGLISYTAISLLAESIDGIVHPEEVSVAAPMVAVVAVSAAAKLFLGLYTIRTGRETGSASLEAVGTECRNDSAFSVLTIASAIVFLTTGFSADAYVGIVFALIILKTGVDTLASTASELLGRPGEKELAEKLYSEIRGCDGVINAADMMLHNYGPESYSGSVNIEIDCGRTAGDVYEQIHELQLRIMHEYNVTMVFGIYAVNQSGDNMRILRNAVAEFVRDNEHVESYHALYISEQSKKLYCDLIVDYELEDWDKLRCEIEARLKKIMPDYSAEITVETEYV